jgi:hypothetical protein
MRRVLVIAALALLAGCGSDDGSGGSQEAGGSQAADTFIACFKAPGYKAVKPAAGQESLFALEAEREGYPNTPVNVNEGKASFASVFLIFFEDGDKAKLALDQLGRETAGDIPPQQRGPAVIAYPYADDKEKTERAVNGCL